MNRLVLPALAVIGVVACSEPTQPRQAPRLRADLAAPGAAYTITDIGNLGGTFVQAFRINPAGQVIGESTTPSGDLHAFLWTAARGMRDLGTLGGPTSFAWGITPGGNVVGQADLPSGATHAFLWTPAGGMRDLGTLGGPNSVALGVNPGGEAVGVSRLVAGGTQHGFVWTAEGGMQDVGTLNGTNTILRTIDNEGTTGAGSGNGHAVLWHASTGFQELAPGGNPSYAARINQLQQVVGFAFTAPAACCHAFIWTAGTGMVDLGALSGPNGTSDAIDINNLGHVVGSTTTPADPNNTHAYIWTAATGMRLLSDLPGEVDSGGYGINDVGQIIGFADTPDGRTHGVLWTPIQ